MKTTEKNKTEEKDTRPDFLKSPREAEDFGGHANEANTKESFPDMGNQSQTQAVTNADGLDIEPEPRDDGGIVGPND